MRKIKLNDITLKEYGEDHGFTISYKDLIEVSKILDRLRADVITLPPITEAKLANTIIHTITAAVSHSTIAMSAGVTEESLKTAWSAVCGAKHPRLYLELPVSTVQMEFMTQKRPDSLLATITDITGRAGKLCTDVEFVAQDATRAEFEFLVKAVNAAIAAGATTVTLCDSAGTMLPEEFTAFLNKLYAAAPKLKEVSLGIRCANTLSLAAINAYAAMQCGASEVCAAVCAGHAPAAADFLKLLRTRADLCDVSFDVKMTEFNRGMEQIAMITRPRHEKNAKESNAAIFSAAADYKILLQTGDSLTTVAAAVRKLGYELSEEDLAKVFESFNSVAAKKSVGTKELEAIIASSAMQVPPTYKLTSYVINCGNRISTTAVVHMEKNGKAVQGMAMGNGPIDAAFLAIEQITGRHYDLDDFQIQAVTEGREAMGSTLIRLRSEGKLYSGNGISPDIIEASIRSYMNALNKIAFEEAQA